MKYLIWFIGAVAALKVVRMPLSEVQSPVAHDGLNHKRDDGSSGPIELGRMRNIAFMANVSVGTPPQIVRAIVDTSSSEIGILASNSDSCSERDCSLFGSFDLRESSSSQMSAAVFEIGFMDGSQSTGPMVYEKVSVGDAEVPDMLIALATKTNLDFSVFGLGLRENEVTIDTNGTTYNTFPEMLVKHGHTLSPAYSMYTKDDKSFLIFGGVDMARYHGRLVDHQVMSHAHAEWLMNLRPEYNATDTWKKYYTIGLHQVVMRGGSDSSSLLKAMGPAIIDSGTGLIILPVDAVRTIARSLSAQYNYRTRLYERACMKPEELKDMYLEFMLSNQLLKVPMEYILRPGNELIRDHGPGCALALSGASDSDPVMVLGQPFLRATYAVFDPKNYVVSLAAANHEDSDPDIYELNGDGVAGMV